ncbi:GGDEF domain-containing protein [Nocardia miyunensis]|uniref:GGDEF domain-containing protein n=1 Tax=Nocardia miyunensis TaxID=282684 RepID=UPI000830416D|nr:GGDEF domain-containing protein [Nocardia miyunensis]
MMLSDQHTVDLRHLAGPLWRAFVPMIAAVMIALPLVTAAEAVVTTVLAAVVATTVAMIALGVRRHRPPAPMPWYLLAGSALLFGFGIMLRDLIPAEGYLFDDMFTLSGYAGVLLAALLWLAPRRVHGGGNDLLLDSGLIGMGALLASWTFLISPILGGGHGSGALIAACYPVIDALLLTVVTHSVVTAMRSETSLRLLHTSLLAILVADFGYNLVAAGSIHLPFQILLIPLLGAYLLVGLAALHPTMVTLGQQQRIRPDQSRQRASFIAVALVVASLVPTMGHRPSIVDRVVISALLAGLLIGVLARSERAIGRSARSERRAQYQADHDMLTGLLNRSALLRAPARNHERWAGRTLCLLFIDLDGFKSVNDSYGHAIGDELIANAAARIRRVIRHDDVAARYGGDEFVVLTCANRSDTATLAERLIAAFGNPFELSVGAVSITASIGIALGSPRPPGSVHEIRGHAARCPEPAETEVTPDPAQDVPTPLSPDLAPTETTVYDLLREADSAMYHAKEYSLGYVFHDEMRHQGHPESRRVWHRDSRKHRETAV